MARNSLQRRTETVDVYRRVTGIMWERLSPQFGIRTINAIARNVIARKESKFPALATLRVEEEGLEWGDFTAQVEGVPESDVRRMLDEFLDEFFEALADLIGRLVMGKLFAEEMARKGEQE